MIKDKFSIVDEVRALAVSLDNAAHGTKGRLKEAFMREHNWSLPKLHRELKAIGWTSGRKKRSDAGTSSVSDDVLTELGGMLLTGIRKNGKATAETPITRARLKTNGRDIPVSNSRLNQLLRDQKLSLKKQCVPKANIRMRSKHPNHVHQVDPSLCLLYYTPNGQQRMIRDDQLYKNKPEFEQSILKLKCWRYVLIDHYSSSIIVRYYQSAGESSANLYDFLLYCWEKREGRLFHGVPSLMVWDKGSANTSSAIKIALKALQVDLYAHQAGAPRVKGAVENANNLVEKLFESGLRYEPVNSVEELNEAVEAWTIAYNTNSIPHYDSRLNRVGAERVARFELWQTIREHQLRLLPDLDVCRQLLSSEPIKKQVRGDNCVTFRHPVAKKTLIYSLSGIAGVEPKAKIMIAPLIYGDFEVVVTVCDYADEPVEHVIKPMALDPMSGQPLDAPVWGDDIFKSHKDSDVDKASKRAQRAMYPDLTDEERDKAITKNVPPLGGLVTHSHLKDIEIPGYMNKKGTSLNVPPRFEPVIEILSTTQIAMALVKRYSMKLTPQDNQFIQSNWPDGIAENELATVHDALLDYQTKPMRLIK